ncbi:MAG: single-stranded DNA-binding protein [archaeon]
MSTINQTIISGNLVRDAEFNEFNNNGRNCKKTQFRIASDRSYKDTNGNWQKTDLCYIDCKGWDWQGEKTKNLKKGDRVLVQGKLKYDEGNYEGHSYKKHFIKIYNCIILSNKNNREQDIDDSVEGVVDSIVGNNDYDSLA